MTTQNNDMTCTIICWMIGVLLGALTAAGLMVVGWSFLQGAFMGVVAWLIVGGALSIMVCSQGGRPQGRVEALQAEMDAARARVQGGAEIPTAAPAPTVPAMATGVVKPSTPLAGEAELASRKGTWTYSNGASDAAPEAADKPETLSAARDGGADDLKKIKGVGPKLEGVLNSMGFYHFDQVAAWTEAELAWVDENLEGFKGRASRDEWVAQAKLLASGGETEFSKRVDEGDVYDT